LNLRALNNKRLFTDIFNANGFEISFSQATRLTSEEEFFSNWLKENKHGQMDYMANHFDKRLDPRILLPGTKSVVSFSYNYYPIIPHELDKGTNKISKYAWGKDYHKVIKKRVHKLLLELEKTLGSYQHRVFVDSAPVMDKAWAKRSGLGWVGKHTNIISKQKGSFFFLGEVLVDLEFDYGNEIDDYCGTCTKCIDACPTEALEPYKIDASKCISYLTIELKDSIPIDFKGKMEEWVFGCDICQDVCPWNRFSTPTNETKFLPSVELIKESSTDFKGLNENRFNEVFQGTALKRTGFDGFTRNLKFISEQSDE
jgi:epoxyqueuosine reductase